MGRTKLSENESFDTVREEVKPDAVNHPSHYAGNGGIECIDAIESAVSCLSGIEAFCAGNALKYIWRFNSKNGVEDLDKAEWYLNKLRDVRSRRKGKK